MGLPDDRLEDLRPIERPGQALGDREHGVHPLLEPRVRLGLDRAGDRRTG